MATTGQQTPPSTSERIDLSLKGLGEEVIVPQRRKRSRGSRNHTCGLSGVGGRLRNSSCGGRAVPTTASYSDALEWLQRGLFANNKPVETYTRVVSESGSSNKKDYGIRKRKFKNKKHTERRKKTRKDIRAMRTESNRKYIKNLSNLELTNDQINLLSRGLKFVPTPTTNETALRKQPLRASALWKLKNSYRLVAMK